jgi:hypothetical protein
MKIDKNWSFIRSWALNIDMSKIYIKNFIDNQKAKERVWNTF